MRRDAETAGWNAEAMGAWNDEAREGATPKMPPLLQPTQLTDTQQETARRIAEMGPEFDLEAYERNCCNYAGFYLRLGGSERLRQGFLFREECWQNKEPLVECTMCGKLHHKHCFQQANYWNGTGFEDEEEETYCFKCYNETEGEK